jgi:hypothetical protein
MPRIPSFKEYYRVITFDNRAVASNLAVITTLISNAGGMSASFKFALSLIFNALVW